MESDAGSDEDDLTEAEEAGREQPQAIRVTIRSGPSSGTSATVEDGRIVLGRAEDCDLTVPDPKASRRHA
ncbi:MAG: FHA domain-containing protein, partial [Actinomycetota bacterium]|nr:FHA domain-containing protein [Actinomycetota bacterium]